MALVLEHCTIFDGHSAELREGASVYVEGGLIREVAEHRFAHTVADRLNVRGQFVMPGLIDAHFHAYFVAPLSEVDRMPPGLRALRARAILEETFRRGFTTVRDAAGGDHVLAEAIACDLIEGPRFFYPGLALSQTGGHGDLRAPGHFDRCGCGYCGSMSIVVDGPDAVRRIVREQLRTGAHQIKIFVSGGVISPSDPVWMDQFTDEEIRAAVSEAATRRTYVMAHAHTNEAILRCIKNGVRSIEHATLVEADGARAIAEHGAFAVPTLAIGEAMNELGEALGMSRESLAKSKELDDRALLSLERLHEAGARIGFGTDLLYEVRQRQSREFLLRREALSAIEILRSATSINAHLLHMGGRLGTIAPGAYADILVIDGDPLKDIAVLEQHDRINVIMKAGRLYKNRLHQTAGG